MLNLEFRKAIQLYPITHRFLTALVVLVSLGVPAAGFCGSWENVGEYVQEYVSQAREDAKQTRALVEEEKERLMAEATSVEESVKRQEAKLQEMKGRFDRLMQQEEDAKARFRQEQQDVERFLEVYRTARKDAEALLASSLLRTRNAPSREKMDDSDTSGKSPSLTDIQGLVDQLFTEANSSGAIERREGVFIGPQGTEVAGEILHIGDFNAFYRTSGAAGFLKLDGTTDRLVGIPASASWFDNQAEMIGDYLDGKADVLPMDLSKGEVFAQIAHGKTLLEYLNSGGPLVWPIMVLGLVALVLIAERFIFLARTKANSQKLIASIQQLASNGKWHECREYCDGHRKNSVCRVLRAGLGNLGNDREVVENALQEAIMKELPRLERFLSTISVLAAVAPLLGLLGTVSGMINTFHAITVYGSGDPRMLSAGISEALITTELGLMVAVPVLLLHHFLERRVDAIIGDMEEKSTALTVIMLKNRGTHAGMVGQAA